MKKFICLILVLSLLVSSVGAVEVYELEADSKVSLMSSAYDVMTTEITSSDLNTYLGTSSPIYTLFHSYHTQFTSFLWYLKDFFEDYFGYSTASSSDSIAKDFDTLIAIMRDVGGMLSTGLYSESSTGATPSPFYVLNRYYLDSSGGQSTATNGIYLAELVRNGFLGLKTVIENQSNTDYSTVLSQILTAVNNVDSALDTVNSSVGSVNTSVGQVNSSVSQVNSSILSGNSLLSSIRSFLSVSGNFLNKYGGYDYASSLSSPFLISNGFLGIRSLLTSDNVDFLSPSGTLVNSSDLGISGYGLYYVFTNGFLGLRSLISGSEADNTYSGVSINNENVSSSFSSTGLGPMLNAWLGDIQNDLGVLSYVFASPQDLELKMESEDNMTAVGETILSSDSSSSVKVSDITDISSASDSIQALGETGVTPGQAFAQLGNSDLFSFFSAETAANLDTTVSTYADDPSQQIVTNYYEQNRLEFFDLIGKGGEG